MVAERRFQTRFDYPLLHPHFARTTMVAVRKSTVQADAEPKRRKRGLDPDPRPAPGPAPVNMNTPPPAPGRRGVLFERGRDADNRSERLLDSLSASGPPAR